MQIAHNKVALFNYQLSDEGGEAIEHSEEPVAYLHGNGNIIPGLEEALLNHAAGDSFSVTIPPERAYGHRKPEARQRIPIKHLHTNGKPRVGQVVQVNTDQGARQVTVEKVGKFNVDVDTNHPLAGKTLVFDIEVVDVRDATAEEIAHGHAHGVGGHHH